MFIREAIQGDETSIKTLLEQLGYPMPSATLSQKILDLLSHPDYKLFVYEMDHRVVAFISIHFMMQIAVNGDFATICHFAVDESVRSKGIGREMESYAVRLAKERGCERIQLHSNIKRTAAHRFYEREGYEESPKFFRKNIQ